MLSFLKREDPLDGKETVDRIENIVYASLKPLGFRKFGRTLHRFVSGDISQVIHFQSGMYVSSLHGSMCVNLGIRVPECAERTFTPAALKKYYREYDCNIRSRLGTVSGKKETWYDLEKPPEKTAAMILCELEEVVLPIFDSLNSREAILSRRREYPLMDTMGRHLTLLEESFIYGRRGDPETAKARFEAYYRQAVCEYQDKLKNGTKHYLRKGEIIISGGKKITAEEDGYYTLHRADDGHIRYLDELAKKLGLRP